MWLQSECRVIFQKYESESEVNDAGLTSLESLYWLGPSPDLCLLYLVQIGPTD